MATPSFTMRQLLEAGVHFGHHTRRWNPKMSTYIFGIRNGVHVIDLEQTVPMLHRALHEVQTVVAGGGRVLFVGTKRQASTMIAESAKRCGQYYVNHRWLGGMLTNWRTISNSIKRLRGLDEKLVDDQSQLLTKKEIMRINRERDKLERALGGIKEMGGLPNILFVIDTNKEAIAIAEANKLGIPVVAVIDSNSNPVGITHPIPGNDDAMRAINLYCELMCDAVLTGLQEEMRAAGVDVGASEEAPQESLSDDAGKAKAESPKAESAVAPAQQTAAQAAAAAAPESAPVEAAAAEPSAAQPAAEEAAAAPAQESAPEKAAAAAAPEEVAAVEASSEEAEVAAAAPAEDSPPEQVAAVDPSAEKTAPAETEEATSTAEQAEAGATEPPPAAAETVAEKDAESDAAPAEEAEAKATS